MKYINYISAAIIPLFVFFVVIYGFIKKVRVFDSFVLGAKDGVGIILKIFPYIITIFVAIKSFQASGAFDFLKNFLANIFVTSIVPPEVFSVAIVKPLSGSASLGIFTDIVKLTGPDSLATLISAVIMGSAETTFYVLAVYLGAIGIKKTKFLVPVCVISDVLGIAVAVFTVLFFYSFLR